MHKRSKTPDKQAVLHETETNLLIFTVWNICKFSCIVLFSSCKWHIIKVPVGRR